MSNHESSSVDKSIVIKIVIAAIVILAFVLTGQFIDYQQVFRDILSWISGLGIIGILVFILIYILACIFLLPGSILTLGAGILFGVLKGSLIVSAASTLGAALAFVIGRYFTRDWISKKMAGNQKFIAIDQAVGKQGWKIVLLMRLSPLFPFNLLNYAFGLTQVSLKHYVSASWIGMIPGTIMYVYIGSLAGDLASLGSGQRSRTTGEWILYGIGLFATIVVTIFVTRIAKKAIAEHILLKEDAK